VPWVAKGVLGAMGPGQGAGTNQSIVQEGTNLPIEDRIKATRRGLLVQAARAGLVEQLPVHRETAPDGRHGPGNQASDHEHLPIRQRHDCSHSLTAPWTGLMLPQDLQPGHCQWCARALNPQRWQR